MTAASSNDTWIMSPPRLSFATRARGIDQDAPHQLRRDGEKVRAALPPHTAGIDQAEVGLVDQRRGLELVAGPLAGHVAMRQLMQFVLDERHQLRQGVFISCIPRQEELRNLL